VACDASARPLVELLIERCVDGFIAVDGAGRIVLMNAAAGAIFGVAPDAMLGRDLGALLVPGTIVDHQRYVEDFFAGRGRGVVGTTFESEGWHQDGRRVPIELSLSVVGEGAERVVLATIRDISQRRAVAQRTDALLTQLGQAQRLEALGLLVAGIAHDFNNVVASIIGYASALAAELAPGDHRREDASQILELARRANKLVDSLLAFGRDEPASEVVSLNRVARSVAGFLRRTLPKSIVVRTRLGRGANVRGAQVQLEQLLMNLCLNARDAMPDGGELAIETERVELDERAAGACELVAGVYCELAVSDNGVGMDAETVALAFEPFFTTKPRGAGSGLGLTLARATARQHGGQVRVESQPAKGTTVTLLLPAADEAIPVAAAASAPRAVQGSGETILLVDDERHLREMVKRMLEGLGYCVLLAESGERALEIFRAEHERIALVLLDVALGSMSGLQALEGIRAVDGAVRVLVSSGYDKSGEPTKLLEQGVAGFIPKPYGIDELGQAIRDALGK
jgi:PAS domain S-box-containing protein